MRELHRHWLKPVLRGSMWLLLCAALSTAWSQALTTPSTPAIHALLIGIGDYPRDSGVSRLQGPANDVRLIAEVLKDRFHIPGANIVVLTDKAATHAAIEAEFAALASRMRRDDIVYIHYAGHGSTSSNPAERRGQDQTWVSFGARSPAHSERNRLDVLDKEIAVWMQPLYALSEDVVFVSDSCHSATVSRGLRIPTARTVPPARAVGAVHPLLAALKPVPAPLNGVRVGAARDNESARELDPRTGFACDDGKQCFGVFTWYWAKALRATQPGDAWADVFQRASALVSTVDTVSQVPQIDGRGDRAVFGGRFALVSPALAVTRVADDGKSVRLRGGLLSGVAVGSTYRLAKGVSEPGPLLRITAVSPLVSEASVQNGKLASGDLVTEVSHVYASRPIRLHVTGDAVASVDAKLIQTLRFGLAAATGGALSAFELVGEAVKSDWSVYVTRRNSTESGAGRSLSPPAPSPCSEPTCPAYIWIIAKDGTLLHERLRVALASVDDPVAWLVGNLRKFAWSREVRKLAAEGNRLSVSLTLMIHRPSPGTTDKCPVAGADADPAKWMRHGPYPLHAIGFAPTLGDCLSFSLENKHPEKSWYAYVVAIGPDFAVKRVFPAPNQVDDEARLKPKETPLTAGGFYLLNAPGIETILLVVSGGPVQTITLEQSGVRGKGPSSQLGRLLASRATRGDLIESTVDPWGADAADLVVPPPTAPNAVNK